VYAVYLDYEYDGTRNTVVLGGSIAKDRDDVGLWLNEMLYGFFPDPTFHESISEENLPAGYKFQTYYVAAYDPSQPALGMH
jgi:hypothetical protein